MFALACVLFVGASSLIGPISCSVGLTQLNAEDAAIVLREARPGIDYPIYNLDTLPKTPFSCYDSFILPGIRYADVDTRCQSFHVCDEAKFDTIDLCPNQTIFNDQSQVCEWFHQVDCKQAYKPGTTILTPVTVTETKPIISEVQPILVVDSKPDCVTTCSNTLIPAPVAIIPSQPSPAFTTIQSTVHEPFAPVAVVSSVPISATVSKPAAITTTSAVASNNALTISEPAYIIQSDKRVPRPSGNGVFSGQSETFSVDVSSLTSYGLTQLPAEQAIYVMQTARPGIDYPIYSSIPKTSFSCKGFVLGKRYADVETGCQVFHVCDLAGFRSELCPNMTIFNEQTQVCEWFHQVECKSGSTFSALTFPIASATVTDAKPLYVTSCSKTPITTTAQAIVATKPASSVFQSAIREPRPSAAGAVVSPAIPIMPAATSSVISNAQSSATAIQAPATTILVSPAAAPIPSTQQNTLSTGLLSNLQAGSGWGSALQAAPASRIAFTAANPGSAATPSFFDPFAAYGSGIMNTFVRPFVGFPFNGYAG